MRLAEFYGVSTKRLSEHVKRNKDRFPAGFVSGDLSEAVTDERASLSVSLHDLARKTHRRWCR